MSLDVASDTQEEVRFEKGDIQEERFRDKWWGIIFWAHLLTMVLVAILYSTGTLKSDLSSDRRNLEDIFLNGDEENPVNFSKSDEIRFITSFVLTLVASPILSVLALGFMARNAIILIKCSLYFSIGFNLVWMILLALSKSFAAIFPGFFALILVCYARAVWHRIPYAAANVKVGIACVRANMGMAALSLLSIPLFAGWFFLWAYNFQHIFNSPWMKTQESTIQVTDDVYGTHAEEQVTVAGGFAIFGLVLSFYWTWQVLSNVVHTSLAGTTGTWWFVPDEASSCCSKGLTDSIFRSITYSFGSICLGSLLVAIIETLRSMLKSRARDRGIFGAIAQCLLYYIERLAEYFNRWAFVYVGLYGYSYFKAGKNVLTLFRNKGWTTIISDSLIHRLLFLMTVCVGLVNALIATILSLGADGVVVAGNAFIGLVFGVIMSSLVFGVLHSAIDSVIVLYAEAPAEFQTNHPYLSQEMDEAWAQAWPDIFSPVGSFPVSAATADPMTPEKETEMV